MSCSRCGDDRVPANLTIVDGKPICPECLYKQASHDWTHQTLAKGA